MAIHFIGESTSAAPPFDALFFKTAFDSILEKAGPGAQKLTLFLSDGTAFDVCEVVDLADAFMVVRGYRASTDACDLSMTILPYGLIYRLDLGPKADNSTRVGFRWSPKTTTMRVKTGIRRK